MYRYKNITQGKEKSCHIIPFSGNPLLTFALPGLALSFDSLAAKDCPLIM